MSYFIINFCTTYTVLNLMIPLLGMVPAAIVAALFSISVMVMLNAEKAEALEEALKTKETK